MKTAYIIFRSTKPQNTTEILNLIIHFCKERELKYHLHPQSGNSVISIDGIEYFIDLQEKKEEPEAPYWMICCTQKRKYELSKNIA